MFRLTVQIREITASAAGDQNLLAETVRMLEHRDAPSALAGLDGAHQPRRPAAENQCVE